MINCLKLAVSIMCHKQDTNTPAHTKTLKSLKQTPNYVTKATLIQTKRWVINYVLLKSYYVCMDTTVEG